MKHVSVQERGWAGHLCVGDRCKFHRNTLLDNGDKKVIVSTVGLFVLEGELEEIGTGRHFETMAFEAKFDGRYWDADVSKEIDFDSPWYIRKPEDDDKANEMHEVVVNELIARLEGR